MEYQGFILDSFQEKAISYIATTNSVIVSAPTGAGKTAIAEYAIEKSLAENKEVIYTAPIKALSNQKFRDFTRRYGSKVGIMTGDLTLNGEAPILIMTTEIFRNALLEDPHRFDNVLYLIFDEVHYLDDSERGSVWEESLIFAPSHIKVLCLSATVPNIEELAAWIGQTRSETVQIVHEGKRPVPLVEFCFMDGKGMLTLPEARQYLPKKTRRDWDEFDRNGRNFEPLHGILDHLRRERQIPCLYFVFSRKECEVCAFQCAGYSLLSSEESRRVEEKLKELAGRYQLENHGTGEELFPLLRRGIGYHHAGMLPALKEIVEQLFTEGLIKVLFATETFALGVNMPATSVVFNALKKFDGNSVRCLKSLEYQQMSGRAGRRGLDPVGYVYANLTDEVVSREELDRILKGPLEPISSQFNLSYSTLLSLYERIGEDVIKTCDKSFGTFQKALVAQQVTGKKQKKRVMSEQRKLVQTKLTFLKTIGYIGPEGLTSKGRFATNLSGYEVQLTELFFGGLLESVNEITLFVILVSLVYEGKKSDWGSKIPKDLQKIATQIERRIFTVQQIESMFGLREIKPPDFRLTVAAYAWATGKPFHELENYCHASSGDVIRAFRLALQLCRQLGKSCSGYGEFVKRLDQCVMAVNRDEVNALKQLEAFTSFSELSGMSPKVIARTVTS